MNNDLISLIEGAAPTIAAALVPGALSGPAGALASVAIAHLADGLGLPHPASPEDIIGALTGQPDVVKTAVLTRADANFQATLSPVVQQPSALPEASAPVLAPVQGSPVTHAGVTSDLPSMIVFMIMSAVGGILAHKGVNVDGISQAITGSTDLHVGASIIAGTLMLVWRHIRGTNANTNLLASSGKS